jgi:TonB family protein
VYEAVSDVLIERAHDPEGLGRMLWVSIGAHVTLLAVLVFVPGWRAEPHENTTPLFISLGGSPGQRTGGMTPIAGRAIQEVATPQAVRTPPAPPAPKPPEMVLPREQPQARPRPAPPVSKPAEQASGRRPSTGAVVQSGSARADTGAAGNNFGLTTGGGSGTGGYLDVGNFCCPEYLETMRQLIQRNWDPRQSVTGSSQVKFTIQRDGTLSGIELEKPSGYFVLDRAALSALSTTRRLPPLPREFTEDHLTVHLVFQYQR